MSGDDNTARVPRVSARPAHPRALDPPTAPSPIRVSPAFAPSTASGPVLVLGASGMLGHRFVQVAARTLDVRAAVRQPWPRLAEVLGVEAAAVMPHVDVTQDLGALLDAVRPAVVVNCAGALKPVSGTLDPAEAIAINALAPHRLASAAAARGIRLIHISTDCVFDGARGHYSEDDVPDATDLYGRSKALGEVTTGTALTIRTSIVGRQLQGARGLLEWFLAQRGRTVQGYHAMRFSGLTTTALSEAIVDVITRHPALAGCLHIVGPAISKYDLLQIMNDTFRADVTIVGIDGPTIDRTLDGRRFAALNGPAPSWRAMLSQAALDSARYDGWRQRVP